MVPGALRVCFVCLGNICRSPAAEAVFRYQVDEAGLAELVLVDSAGTARYHLGERPDRRTVAEARRRGLVADHQARQLSAEEIPSWDLLLAMDGSNRHDITRLAGRRTPPPGRLGERVRLLRSFDTAAVAGDLEVPDPYYEDDSAFARMFDLIEPAGRGLLEHLEQALALEHGDGHRR